MMIVFNLVQTIGYYGFASWVPTLLISQGITVTRSLGYTFVVALAAPVGPLLATRIADGVDRKWLVTTSALGIGVFGLLFSQQTTGSGHHRAWYPDPDQQHLPVVLVPRVSGGDLPDAHPGPRGRFRLFVEPLQRDLCRAS